MFLNIQNCIDLALVPCHFTIFGKNVGRKDSVDVKYLIYAQYTLSWLDFFYFCSLCFAVVLLLL